MKNLGNNSENELSNFKGLEKLGEGTYGIVFKAIDKRTKDFVAVKKIKLQENEGVPSTTMREITALKATNNHPNIVEFKEYILADNKLYMIFEYIEFDLTKFFKIHKTKLPNDLVKAYLFQILLGLCHIHKKGYFHRDLKPQNLLVDKDGNLKIADFGLVRLIEFPITKLTHEIQTLWYRAPEVLLGQEDYASEVDIWSVALIFYELAHCGETLLKGDSEIDQIFKIFRLFGTPTETEWSGFTKLPNFSKNHPKFKGESLSVSCPNFNNEALDLFRKMTYLDPKLRISVFDAIYHPYFSDVPKDYYQGYKML